MKVRKLILNSVSRRTRGQTGINVRNEFLSRTTFPLLQLLFVSRFSAKVLALTAIDTQDWAELSWKGLADQNQGFCLWVNLKGSSDSNHLHPLLGNHSFLRMNKHFFCALHNIVNISQKFWQHFFQFE